MKDARKESTLYSDERLRWYHLASNPVRAQVYCRKWREVKYIVRHSTRGGMTCAK